MRGRDGKREGRGGEGREGEIEGEGERGAAVNVSTLLILKTESCPMERSRRNGGGVGGKEKGRIEREG